MSGMVLKKTNHPRPKRVGKNSTLGEKTAVRIHAVLAQIFGGRTVLKLIGTFAAVVIIVGAVFWYKSFYSNPERVFWGMIDNNLSTPSIVKEISQTGAAASNNERTQLAFSPAPLVRDIKEIKTQNSTNDSRIKIESIGTPTDTYQHYLLIDQSSKSGKAKPDYNKVYSLWLKNSGNKEKETALFNNVIYSAALFGNQPAAQRAKTINYLKDSYYVNFNNVKKQSSNGRKTYEYNVKIKMRKYSVAANFYAKSLGLPNAGQINPNNYKPTDEVAVNFTVDVLSRQLRKVEYASSGSAENYTTYGVVPTFKLPTHTVSYETLQKAVEKATAK